jgi:hypothetical protein
MQACGHLEYFRGFKILPPVSLSPHQPRPFRAARLPRPTYANRARRADQRPRLPIPPQ